MKVVIGWVLLMSAVALICIGGGMTVMVLFTFSVENLFESFALKGYGLLVLGFGLIYLNSEVINTDGIH